MFYNKSKLDYMVGLYYGVGIVENLAGTQYPSKAKNFCQAGTRYPSVPTKFIWMVPPLSSTPKTP